MNEIPPHRRLFTPEGDLRNSLCFITNSKRGFAIVRRQGRFRANRPLESSAMKTFTIAAVMLALLTTTAANAQAKRPREEQKQKTDDRPKVDEKAYKAALEKIPEPKEKYDPWGVARPAEPAKKPK
jgi:hypothetical protein